MVEGADSEVGRPGSADVDDLLTLVVRVERLLEEEGHILMAPSLQGLRVLTERKTRLLVDLNRVCRKLPPGAGEVLGERLAGLRARLDVNAAILEMHLAAAREIATIVTRAIADHESDGTYSATSRGVVS